MAFNPGAVVDKIGNVLVLAEVTDAWALKTLTLGTNSIHAGHLASSTVGQQTTSEEFINEDGKPVKAEYTHSLTTTGVLMQSDKTTIDFFAEATKGKYFLQYKYMGIVDGKKQEIFTLGQVTPQFAAARPGGTTSMPYEFKGIYPTATVAFTSTNLVAIEAAVSAVIYCTGVSITASQGFVVKETA
jgi:hypothetical protein